LNSIELDLPSSDEFYLRAYLTRLFPVQLFRFARRAHGSDETLFPLAKDIYDDNGSIESLREAVSATVREFIDYKPSERMSFTYKMDTLTVQSFYGESRDLRDCLKRSLVSLEKFSPGHAEFYRVLLALQNIADAVRSQRPSLPQAQLLVSVSEDGKEELDEMFLCFVLAEGRSLQESRAELVNALRRRIEELREAFRSESELPGLRKLLLERLEAIGDALDAAQILTLLED